MGKPSHVVTALLLASAAPATADSVVAVFVSEPRDVRRATPAGADPLITNSGDFVFCHGIALRPATAQLYYGSATLGTISRCNIDGTSCSPIIIDAAPGDIVIDDVSGTLYWASFDGDEVWRADLDGANATPLVDETYGGSLSALDLDRTNGKLYWASWNAPAIKRSALNGSMIEDVTPVGVGEPRAIALDVAGGKLYWADDGTSPAIRRANLDGSSPETLVSSAVDSPWGLALDLENGKLYWADVGFVGVANLDGTEATRWADSGTFQHSGIALQFGPTPMNLADAAVDAMPGGRDAGMDNVTNDGCTCRSSSPSASIGLLLAFAAALRRRRAVARVECSTPAGVM